MKTTRAAVLASLLALTPAASAQTSLAPSFSAGDVRVNENAGSAVVTVTKAAGKNGYSQVAFATVDGTAKAGVDYQPIRLTLTFYSSGATSQQVRIPVLDSKAVYTTRAFTVRLTAVHNAVIGSSPATITIVDQDAPAPPPAVTWSKCADEGGHCYLTSPATVRYGSGTTWLTRSVTADVACDNATWGDPTPGVFKECDTDGVVAAAPAPTPTPVPAPQPTPVPTGSWVIAPLAVGGYARPTNLGPCCSGLIVRIVDSGITSDADPAKRQHWWAFVYYSDSTGNFPASNPYWSTAWMYGFDESLQGVAPAP